MNISAAVVAALFTALLFIHQWVQHNFRKKVDRANYKLALFDKRMTTYLALEDMLRAFIREGGPPIEDVIKLRHEARNASFLLPDKACSFIEEIVEKGFDYKKASVVWEPLRKRAYEGETLPPADGVKLKKLVEEMHEIINWFLEQINNNRLQDEFSPFLKLPESV